MKGGPRVKTGVTFGEWLLRMENCHDWRMRLQGIMKHAKALPEASMPSMTKEDFHRLEESERRAVLAGNVSAIETLWSPELLVNAPHNRLLVGVDATLDMVRKGVIDFERFDRTVERVEIDGDMAVSMGSEAIMQKHGPQAGELIHRRYTNVWRHSDGQWRLRYRHANVVPKYGQILD